MSYFSSVLSALNDKTHLTGNPLRCDCRLHWLWELSRKKNREYLVSSEHDISEDLNVRLPRCQTPLLYRDWPLHRFSGKINFFAVGLPANSK